MRLWTLIKVAGGLPKIDPELPYHGHVQHCQKGNWGLYTLAGTKGELIAIGTSDPANILPIALNEFPDVATPEATLDKINPWMANNGFDTISYGTSGIETAKAVRAALSEAGLIEWVQESIHDPEEEVGP